MADTSRNVFDVLEDDIEDSEPAKGAAPADNTESVAATIVSVASSALAAEGESGDAVEAQSWTDVGRTRRLVPKYSLSKEVMGLEAARKSAPPTPSGNVSAVESKKKVIRFTREEILLLRKPSKSLPELEKLGDIIFPGQQDPECFKQLDADEVYRLWHAAPESKGRAADAGRGRGRGRGKAIDGEEHGNGEWSRGAVAKGGDSWDDIGAGGKMDNGLDLADFSAATLKFRTEMGDMAKDDNIELYDSNDVMEGLFREQRGLARAPSGDAEDEAAPEWADVDVRGELSAQGNFFGGSASEPQATNAGGRAILNALLPSAGGATLNGETSDSVLRGGNGEVDFRLESQTVEIKLESAGVEQQQVVHLSPVVQAAVAPPLPSLDEAMWMYLDPRNRPQGPFATTSMRQWMVDGYFTPTLPIKLAHWADFHPLYSVFLDAMSAFRVVPLEPNAEVGSVPVQSDLVEEVVEEPKSKPSQSQPTTAPSTVSDAAEPVAPRPTAPTADVAKPDAVPAKSDQKKREKTVKSAKVNIMESSGTDSTTQKESNDNKKKKESAKAPWGKPDNTVSTGKSISEIQAEEQKVQVQSARPANHNSDQQKVKSSQLKSLLGLPSSPQKESIVAKTTAAGASWGSSNGGKGNTSSSKSLKEIQDEEEKVRKQQDAVAKQNAAASIALSVQAAPKWKVGSAGPKIVESSNSPSLSEIMRQEERARLATEAAAPGAPQISVRPATAAGSWAAKAGKQSSGGSYNAAQMVAPKSVAAAPSAGKAIKVMAPVEAQKPVEVDSFWNFSDGPSANAAKNTNPTPAAGQAALVQKKTSSKNDFGGHGMPANMSEWCTSQLLKLKKDADLTLIQFCYTLQSPVEIREYFAEYLGSTPQVSQFATEFIQRKEGKIPAASGPVAAPGAAALGSQAGAKKKKSNKAPK